MITGEETCISLSSQWWVFRSAVVMKLPCRGVPLQQLLIFSQ